MTTFVPYYNETVAGIWKSLANSDSLYVGAGIQIGSTGSVAVLGTSNNLVMVDGTLAGVWGAGLGATSQVVVGSTGTIMGSTLGVYTFAAGSTIWNEGKIFGGAIGISDLGAAYAEIHNAGTIFVGAGQYSGKNAAIDLSGSSGTFIENSGTIRVQASTALAIDASSGSGAQSIVNTGRITGGISLGGGSDSYNGASGRHVSGNLDGGAGNDTIMGGADADRILGGTGDDVLSGGGGADMIWGGVGKDRMTGGASADVFVFNSALNAANVDAITDFKKVDDTIYLENAIFTALGAGKLASSQFYAASGATKAHDSDDRIVYNKTTGKLYYDDDGKGGHAAVHFATLTGHPGIAAADFLVI